MTREPRTRVLRTRTLLAVGLILVAAVLGAFYADVAGGLERETVDLRFSIRGEEAPPPELVVVGIDDVTFDDLDLQWPFPRTVHASAIDRISRDEPMVLVYDIQFTEPTAVEEDNALIEAVERASRVVLATTEVDEAGGTNILGGLDLAALGARPASALLEPDPDGVIRRFSHTINGLATVPIVAAETAAGRSIDPAELPDDGALIDFFGDAGTIETVSFSDVQGLEPGFFSDRIVVVGATAPSLQDRHATSTAASMSGAELQATAIATALGSFPLESDPAWLTVVLIVLAGLLPALIALGARLRWVVAGGLSAVVALAIAAQVAFNQGLVLTTVYPVAAAVLGTIGAIVVYATFEALERERTREAFARFVPPQVVDEVLEQAGDDLRLGGTQLDGTVVFVDLRGFTGFVEGTEPSEVITVLNEYLDAVTTAVERHGGTIVAYMGDGIMSVFGAPLPDEDHAESAVAAVRELVDDALPRWNAWLATREHRTLDAGIGVASGSVMSGNVGSARRVEYTALGDATNTAARLQAMTAELGHTVLVAASTVERLGSVPTDLQPLHRVGVRGKAEDIGVFTLTSEGPQGATSTLAE